MNVYIDEPKFREQFDGIFGGIEFKVDMSLQDVQSFGIESHVKLSLNALLLRLGVTLPDDVHAELEQVAVDWHIQNKEFHDFLTPDFKSFVSDLVAVYFHESHDIKELIVPKQDLQSSVIDSHVKLSLNALLLQLGVTLPDDVHSKLEQVALEWHIQNKEFHDFLTPDFKNFVSDLVAVYSNESHDELSWTVSNQDELNRTSELALDQAFDSSITLDTPPTWIACSPFDEPLVKVTLVDTKESTPGHETMHWVACAPFRESEDIIESRATSSKDLLRSNWFGIDCGSIDDVTQAQPNNLTADTFPSNEQHGLILSMTGSQISWEVVPEFVVCEPMTPELISHLTQVVPEFVVDEPLNPGLIAVVCEPMTPELISYLAQLHSELAPAARANVDISCSVSGSVLSETLADSFSWMSATYASNELFWDSLDFGLVPGFVDSLVIL